MWFERVCNWRYLAWSRTSRDFATLRLHSKNIDLFSDPLFQLPHDMFDDDGVIETIEVVAAKPERAWTALDRQRIGEISEKLAARQVKQNIKKKS
jgi:hypothetical protein